MLNVTPIRGNNQYAAAHYFSAADDYYGKDSPGEWQGKGAQTLGLTGSVEHGELSRLLNGELPNGERIQTTFDPADKKIVWEYSGPKGWFISDQLGECYRQPNGNTLMTASDNGHSIEVTPDKKIVWEFYNPHRTGQHNDLIAVTYQMQRLDHDKFLKWLKKQH